MTIQNNTTTIINNVQSSGRKVLTATAIEWRNGIIECLTGTRSGRRYRIGKSFYRASSPGEAPASRTGALRSSYRFRVLSNTEAEVGSPQEYGLMLEKGTKNVLPRPHVVAGFTKNKSAIERALTSNWDV